MDPHDREVHAVGTLESPAGPRIEACPSAASCQDSLGDGAVRVRAAPAREHRLDSGITDMVLKLEDHRRDGPTGRPQRLRRHGPVNLGWPKCKGCDKCAGFTLVTELGREGLHPMPSP